MTIYHEVIELETEIRPSFHDISDQVNRALAQSGVSNGLVAVFSQHTTCSIIIQEDSTGHHIQWNEIHIPRPVGCTSDLDSQM